MWKMHARLQSLPGIHGNEKAHPGVQRHGGAVSEHKGLAPLAHGTHHAADLLGTHRQHIQVDAIKLVEASPQPRLH